MKSTPQLDFGAILRALQCIARAQELHASHQIKDAARRDEFLAYVKDVLALISGTRTENAPPLLYDFHTAPNFNLGIPMLLYCPVCHGRHIDAGEFATKPHHTHACQHCGNCWRPAVVNTCGVQFLPKFKDES